MAVCLFVCLVVGRVGGHTYHISQNKLTLHVYPLLEIELEDIYSHAHSEGV